MLAYLEELCAALLGHDAVQVHRLLADPHARALPRQVREEAIALSRASAGSLRAPIHTLRFYHQTLELGGNDPGPGSGLKPRPESDSAETASTGSTDAAPEGASASGEHACTSGEFPIEQMELPLAGGTVAA